ncbi:VOC family protein [Arthrobacter sulfonylureivorans]|uniref:VOC family protein n=1 Tax=Arthrobacter sulfonylureivorans TaxID=2486855 RepID=A0ABY3WHE2_9MICC|nr:VOC family protein [Arthrobacter sulfonylureivorans]UNK47104.1 VOC family protein [Arthrobacter sulfonylureivorans]
MAIQTTDVEGSIFDATQLLGLHVTEQKGNEVYLAAGAVHHELVYIESETNGIHSIGLLAKDGDALRTIRRRVEDENLRIISEGPECSGIEDGFSFVGPEGWIFEVFIDMQPAEPGRLSFGPDRYGHINFHPRDVRGMMEFLQRTLDFRLSDIIGDDYAYFMRCSPDHHGIALIQGQGTFHHHAWQAQSIVDLGKLGDRLNRVGRELIWGPVRHGAGHNVAAYYVETSGAVVELYTDLEQIYDENRPPVKWSGEENWWNMWSSYRPESFRDFGIPPVTNRH